MNELKKAFYNVLYKYQKHFSEVGVDKNLEKWHLSKQNLISLLSLHPNWNVSEMAVIFPLSESREIDSDIVDECKFALTSLLDECNMDSLDREKFILSFTYATEEYAKFPSEEKIELIKKTSDIKCSVGQKASRIIGRLCTKYGIDKHKSYNSVYARLSDAFNPLQVSKTGVLSVHPCDYLEMSNKDNSWESCHRLNGGSYQAGCLSYLRDSVTMIFYTVDDNVTQDFHKHPKRTRQIFCFSDDLLMQSRLYPSDNNEQSIQYREIVQRTLSKCLQVPNLWILKSTKAEVLPFLVTAEGSHQYPDYIYDHARVCKLKGSESTEKLLIGGAPICISCGNEFSNASCTLKCNCKDLVVCADCGETVSISKARYHENVYSCNKCLHRCSSCYEYTKGTVYPAYNHDGKLLEVCQSCYEKISEPCNECSIKSICSLINGSMFCDRSINVLMSI